MEIRLDCSKYLKKINKAEAIKNLFDFNLGSALTEVIGINYSIEMKAFMLLFNSSRETNFQLSKAYGQQQINTQYNLVSISKNFEKKYKDYLEQQVTLTKDFFENVLMYNNQYLIKSFELFDSFCTEIRIVLPNDIRTSYYINFRENLKDEFQNNKLRYRELVDFFDNPVELQNDKFAHLIERYNQFKKYYNTPLQANSKETLQDLYVEPYFTVYKNNLNEVDDVNKHFFSISTESVHDFFEYYFLFGNKNDKLKENYDMVFVLGQPGQGKTSFCYKLIYDYLKEFDDLPPIPIIFEKIRDLIAKDFVNNPLEEIGRRYDFLDFNKDEFILVLDGLDEAYMSGGVTDSDLKNLYDRLKKRPNKKIKIILTSRLNYLNINDSCLDNTLVLHLNELSDSQIIEYCNNFKIFHPNNSLIKNIEGIISEEKYVHIKELLRQAVLMYFIAISNINIDEGDSKAVIYDKIFDSLAQRSWDSNGQLDYINTKLKSNPSLYKIYLREFIRNIAFEIFQSPKLFITVNRLINLDATKLFIQRCFTIDLDSNDRLKEISKYLLISFYFQQSTKDNSETALEFFHNSLWEYLTAEYFWEENKRILLRQDQYDDFQYITKVEYFTFLDKSIGNKSITDSVLYNLIQIIDNDDNDTKSNIYNQSIKLFYTLSQDDFLLKYDRESCLLTASEKTREIFKLFWVFIHQSNKNLNNRIKVDNQLVDYIFLDTSLSLNCDLYNIDVQDEYDNLRFITESILNNLFFSLNIGQFTLLYNHIDSITYFKINFDRFEMHNNKVINMSIVDSRFEENCQIEDNDFNNLFFDYVEVPSEEWFNNFLEKNVFDINFKSNHTLFKKESTNDKNEIIIKYVIENIG